MCEVTAGIIGGILGSIITGIVMWFVAQRQRKQTYYNSLIKLFEKHNWNILSQKLDPGIDILNVSPGISTVCYQHLNLFLYAWLNKSIIEKDKTLKGWKNWSKAIVDGAKKKEREEYRKCYRQILTHGDLYPSEFITWLENELGISAKAFHEVSD